MRQVENLCIPVSISPKLENEDQDQAQLFKMLYLEGYSLEGYSYFNLIYGLPIILTLPS